MAARHEASLLYDGNTFYMNEKDSLTHIMQAYQSREEPERLYAVTGKYWRIMLSITIVICCAAIAGGAYMLVITFFNFAPSKSTAVPAPGLNRNQLAQTIYSLDSRKVLFKELQNNTSQTSDPSR